VVYALAIREGRWFNDIYGGIYVKSHHNEAYKPCDLPRLVELIFRIRKPEDLAEYPTGVDFEEIMDSADVRESTRLWLDEGGSLTGYALIYPLFCNITFEADPTLDKAGLEKEMVAWGLERFRQLKRDGKVDPAATLDTNCSEQDSGRIELLQANGFIPQDLMTLHMSRSLTEAIPSIKLPDGFSIRPVRGEGEADALAALYQAAYGSDRMTAGEILAIMRTSSYDRELDLVAVAPVGRLVGLCTCGIQEDLNGILPKKLGSTDPVLVHPDFQGQGLARALIWSGWEKLKSHGIELAQLSTSSQNVRGIVAFTKVGYVIDKRRLWLSHPMA
jgi:ribosomal protein S18 acetylase RimI-like enzyme